MLQIAVPRLGMVGGIDYLACSNSLVMFTQIGDFLESWTYESKVTADMIRSIPDASMHTKFHPQVRSMARLSWHITQTVSEMPKTAGLTDHDDLEHQPIPESMNAMADVYTTYADKVADALRQRWTDAELREVVPMYGEDWAKGKVLTVLISHQSHHRGQLTVLMRMAGIPVPGVYGPAQEEWAAMGLPAMD